MSFIDTNVQSKTLLYFLFMANFYKDPLKIYTNQLKVKDIYVIITE